MKKKSTTYFLIIAVIGLWGFIGYKILDTLNDSEKVIDSKENPILFEKKKQAITTYHLLPPYTDPFLKGGFIESEITETYNSEDFLSENYNALEIPYEEDSSSNEKDPYFPKVIYKGIVKPNSNHKNIYLVQINDQNEILHTHEEKQGIKIIEGNREKIKISFNGEVKEVYIQ